MNIQCPAFELPESELISEASYQVITAHRQRIQKLIEQASNTPPPTDQSDPREAEREHCYSSEAYKNLSQRYAVDISLEERAGVPVEIFTPQEGVAADNKARLLINLHGGGFMGGSRTLSRLESIPVAALGKIKVLSVD